MKRIYPTLFSLLLLSLLGASWPFSSLFISSNHEAFGSASWMQKETALLKSQAGNIDDKVLQLSLRAYVHARNKGLDSKQLLTVIDYSKPSNRRRLWVFNMKTGRVLYNTWVSHGRNSGQVKATSFSNSPGSLKSSIGVFMTASTYFGGKGYSLRLRGLENGFNDNAFRRDIVIHGAPYVNADIIRKYGQAGRSWGCPAVGVKLATPIINTIKDDTLIFAYYPDPKWLASSRYLV